MTEPKPEYEIGERGDAEMTNDEPGSVEVKYVMVSLRDLVDYWVKDYKDEWDFVEFISDVRRDQILIQMIRKT